MMFLTPGTSLTPRCTACETMRWLIVTATLPTPGSAAALPLDQPAQRLVLALRRIAELDVDGDVAAVDLHLADRLAGDEVAAGVGIDQRTQAGVYVCLGDGHGDVDRVERLNGEFSEKHPPLGTRRFGPFARMRQSPAASKVFAACRAARCSSRPRCPTPTARSTSATSWSTSRPTSGCASSACRATRCISSAPTTRTARRSCSRPRAEGITPQAAGRARSRRRGRKHLAGFHISFDHWHSTDSPENVELSQDIYRQLQGARPDRHARRSSSSSIR